MIADERGQRGQHGRHRICFDLRRPGHADDAGAGLLLRRHGPAQEHPGHPDAVLRDPVPGERAMGALRLQPGVLARKLVHRRALVDRPERGRRGAESGLCGDDPAPGVHDFPGDVRGHHAGLDHRGVRRADEVLRVPALHAALGDAGLRPGLPLGLGSRRLAAQHGRAGFRGRDGGAHHRGRLGAGDGAGDRPAERIQRRSQSAAQPAADGAGRGPAVVRLVRVQRRQRAVRRRAGRQRLRGHEHRRRGRGPELGVYGLGVEREADDVRRRRPARWRGWWRSRRRRDS